MTHFTRIGTLVGIAALGLAAIAGPAAASGHGEKSAKLSATHLTVKATQEKVSKNDKFKASVVATLRSKKSDLANETVGLAERAQGATKWIATGQTATTATNGTVTFTFTQSTTKEQYRAIFAGDTTYAASHSGTITINKSKAAPTS